MQFLARQLCAQFRNQGFCTKSKKKLLLGESWWILPQERFYLFFLGILQFGFAFNVQVFSLLIRTFIAS